MSETKTYKGKIKLVEQKADVVSTIKFYLEKEGITPEEDIDCLYDQVYDDLSPKYELINDKLYEVLSKEDMTYEDITEAHLNDDGTIDYLVQYHNGGRSFYEALSYALNKRELN